MRARIAKILDILGKLLKNIFLNFSNFEKKLRNIFSKLRGKLFEVTYKVKRNRVCQRVSSSQTWKWVLPSDCRALCKMYHSSTRPSLCCPPPWPTSSWSPRAAWRVVWGRSPWTPSPSWSLCNISFLTRLAFWQQCHLPHWRNSIPAVNSVDVTNISYNLENRSTFHGHSWGRGFQLPTSVKLRFLQETELRADWQAGKWREGRCTIPGNASPNPGHPTTSAVPPKSCQSHPKVASFTQKSPSSTKTCHVHPNVAGVNRKMPVSQKAASFTQKFLSSFGKSFRLHPQIAGVNQKLKVSPNTCHCHLKFTVFNQK